MLDFFRRCALWPLIVVWVSSMACTSEPSPDTKGTGIDFGASALTKAANAGGSYVALEDGRTRACAKFTKGATPLTACAVAFVDMAAAAGTAWTKVEDASCSFLESYDKAASTWRMAFACQDADRDGCWGDAGKAVTVGESAHKYESHQREFATADGKGKALVTDAHEDCATRL